MGIYLPVAEAANTSLYVESFGYEPDSRIARWGPGQRNYSILHYVTAGTGYFNGNPVRAGQGFCIRKNQLQEYHSSNDEPWTYFWVIFNGTDTDQPCASKLEEKEMQNVADLLVDNKESESKIALKGKSPMKKKNADNISTTKKLKDEMKTEGMGEIMGQ